MILIPPFRPHVVDHRQPSLDSLPTAEHLTSLGIALGDADLEAGVKVDAKGRVDLVGYIPRRG